MSEQKGAREAIDRIAERAYKSGGNQAAEWAAKKAREAAIRREREKPKRG